MDVTSQIIQRASEVLDERGWTQDRFEDPLTGAVCANRALTLAMEEVTGGLCPIDRQMAYRAAIQRLEPFYAEYGTKGTFWFNDEPERTVEDVKLVFKRAVEAEQSTEREQPR